MTDAQFDEWIAALRSGKYKRNSYAPYNPKDGTYCVLGVYYLLNGITFDKGTGHAALPAEYRPNMVNLDRWEFWNLEHNLGEKQRTLLYRMNDDLIGPSFDYVADRLEARRSTFVRRTV